MYRSLVIFLFSISLFTSCARRAEQTFETMPVTDRHDPPGVLVSAPDADAAEPAVASDAAGNICLAYVVHNADKTADLFFQRFGPDSEPLGEKVRVNPAPGTVKAWRGDPPTVKVAGDGTVFIGWTVKVESGGKPANDLMLSVSRDNGKSFEAPVRVNDDTAPASHGMHSLELGADGRVYMAWLDERNVKAQPDHADAPAGAALMFHHKEEVEPNSEVFFSVSADGGKTFSRNKKLASEVCPCCKTSMAMGPEGRLYLSWRQVLPGGFRHIAVASSSDNGGAFSKGVVVSNDKWKIDACPVSGASMAVFADGVLSVSWYSAGEAGEAGVYDAESRDGGKTFGQRFPAGLDAVSGTPLVLIHRERKSAALVMAARENCVLVNLPRGPLKILDATLPAATMVGDQVSVAFVHTEGEKRSVLMRILNLYPNAID
jgi:hypothetical protein